MANAFRIPKNREENLAWINTIPSAGHPMGPCELADFGGFDVIQMAQDSVYQYTHKESDRLSILYRKMVEAGRLGVKNGKGFYDYLPDGSKRPFKVF
jgi:3-hydroxybutyryl-CoA dehydrogenase